MESYWAMPQFLQRGVVATCTAVVVFGYVYAILPFWFWHCVDVPSHAASNDDSYTNGMLDLIGASVGNRGLAPEYNPADPSVNIFFTLDDDAEPVSMRQCETLGLWQACYIEEGTGTCNSLFLWATSKGYNPGGLFSRLYAAYAFWILATAAVLVAAWLLYGGRRWNLDPTTTLAGYLRVLGFLLFFVVAFGGMVTFAAFYSTHSKMRAHINGHKVQHGSAFGIFVVAWLASLPLVVLGPEVLREVLLRDSDGGEGTGGGAEDGDYLDMDHMTRSPALGGPPPPGASLGLGASGYGGGAVPRKSNVRPASGQQAVPQGGPQDSLLCQDGDDAVV